MESHLRLEYSIKPFKRKKVGLLRSAVSTAMTVVCPVVVCYPGHQLLSSSLIGMPDFLEKLHTAALRAKNLEVGIYDYASVMKSNDPKHQPSQDRLGDNTRPGQIYA